MFLLEAPDNDTLLCQCIEFDTQVIMQTESLNTGSNLCSYPHIFVYSKDHIT